MSLPYTADRKGLSLKLHVQPGASRSEFCGLHGDSLKLRIAARAVEGEANKAVREFLALFFSVPASAVSISRGLTSRRKTALVEGNTDQLIQIVKSNLLEE